VVYVDLDENMPGSQVGKELDDIALKLGTVTGLPEGTVPSISSKTLAIQPPDADGRQPEDRRDGDRFAC